VPPRSARQQRFHSSMSGCIDIGVATQADGSSLLTALNEQLGLKLESSRGPVDVLVIDSVEAPTAD